MRGLIILSIVLLTLGAPNRITFDDIGIGSVTIEPLSTFQFSTIIKVNISGRIIINLAIHGFGNLQIAIKFDDTSISLSPNSNKSITMDTNGTLRFELRAVNYGLSEAKIFGNSTITISKAIQEGSVEISVIPFLLSIILPLIVLYVYEKKKKLQLSSEDVAEVIII